MSSAQTLYRFWDADDTLLYVGLTANPAKRWSQHRRTTSWWPEVADASLETIAAGADARAAEACAIRDERPRYNVLHKPVPRDPGRQPVPSPDDMVGTGGIADLLHITVGRVWQLRQHPDFPAPAYKLRGGYVWHTADIITWAESKGREIHE